MSRVALVHDWLTGMRGGEKVLEAIAELVPGAPLHTLFHFPGSVSPALESHPIETSWLQKLPGLERHYRRFLPLFPAAIEQFDLSGFDLILSTSHCVAKGVIPPPGARHVCYCHTPMRYAWDQEHAYFPHRRGPVARLRAQALSRLRVWDVASAPRVDLFLANSRFVARRIRRYYGRDAQVLHPPVDVERITPDDTVPRGDHLLMIAALAPYKRIDLGVAAARRTGRELVVVGSGPERRHLEARARELAAPVRFEGRVDDSRLLHLLRSAFALVQPGIEDFGIAPVEALATGTPVVARGVGGVVDIVRPGRDGVLYDVSDRDDDTAHVDALVAAIDKAHEIRFNVLDLRERAQQFSKQHFHARLSELADLA
jgi:glycosyltransferase involved in cell wall biosynthesis